MKKTLLTCFLLFALSTSVSAQAQNGVVEKGAAPVKLAGGFTFTEGPAVDKEGHIFFTDQPSNRILKWSNDNRLTVFLNKCGRSNGLYFDIHGRLIACADEDNELWEIDRNGKHRVIVSSYSGKLLNGPNDVWVRPQDNSIYFTDPYFKRDYWNRGPMEQKGEYVYFLSPDRKTLKPVSKDLVKPNGITGTPDGRTLYIADTGAWKTYVFSIDKDGSLKDKRLFCNMGSDGMTIDSEGNIYLTGMGVTVFNREGKQIDSISIPENWTGNVCIGGKDRRTLFITAGTGLYAVRLSVRGIY